MRIRRTLLLLGVALLAGCAFERGVMPLRVEKLFVSHRIVPCMGIFAPMSCMEVRRSQDDEWQLFYGNIEGFTPEPGYAYALEVELYFLPPPIPADGSDRAYKLRRIIWRSQPEVAVVQPD